MQILTTRFNHQSIAYDVDSHHAVEPTIVNSISFRYTATRHHYVLLLQHLTTDAGLLAFCMLVFNVVQYSQWKRPLTRSESAQRRCTEVLCPFLLFLPSWQSPEGWHLLTQNSLLATPM